jgi:tetratricopeptide (TPR) repeat protein
VVLHGLGLAEAAAHRDDKANEAYRRALSANANHIATIIDRAVLQVRRAQGPGNESVREGARGALEGVVSKLVGDSSPGQLARAFLGLAELELARGDLEAARRALASAAAKRRDGDTLLSEELAAAFARAFELDAAEKEARRAVAGFGGTGRLAPRLVLAEVALRRGRPAQALATIEEAGTSRPEALVMRSSANLQLGRKEAARLDAEAALRVQPDSVSARVALARVEIADAHPERAVRELDKLERAGKSAEVAAALGQLHAARNPDKARMWFNEALKRDALLLDARLALARMLREAGKLDDARTELTTLLQLNPAFAPGRRELANLALDQGDAVGARDQFDALAEKEPDLETLLGSARAHLALGDGAAAAERVRRAQKIGPPGAGAEEASAVLARAYLMQHQPDEAVKVLRQVIVGAQRGETAGLLMMAYLDLDQQDKAAAVRLIVPPRVRVSAELITGRARLQVERGRDVAAESLAMEALSRLQKPTAPRWVKAEALAVLGRSRWEQGAFGAALRALRQATELDPKNARAHYYLGLVLEDLRKLPEAMASMETATKVDPKLADAHYYLGRLREETKDARWGESFRAYLEVAPTGIYASEAKRSLASNGAPIRKRKRFR